VEWSKLVSSNSSLAVYMPGSDYRCLSEQLCHAGLAPNTPCVVISGAGRGDQQVLWTDIDRLARREPLPAPALVIVGRCAGRAHEVAHATEACRDWPSTDASASFDRLGFESIKP
jgi:siroheme synthase